MKQTNSNRHNKVKNPNWQETASWLRFKHGRGFELGRTENKSSKWPEWDSNLGPLNWVWCTDHLGLLRPWKQSLKDMAGTLKGNSISPKSFSALSYRCTEASLKKCSLFQDLVMKLTSVCLRLTLDVFSCELISLALSRSHLRLMSENPSLLLLGCHHVPWQAYM